MITTKKKKGEVVLIIDIRGGKDRRRVKESKGRYEEKTKNNRGENEKKSAKNGLPEHM